MILNGFQKNIIFQNRYVALKTGLDPPPPSWQMPSKISILIFRTPPLYETYDK